MTEMPNKQYSLLLVDHSTEDLNILASALQGYHLLTATTGLQALEIANRLQPDLILLGICISFSSFISFVDESPTWLFKNIYNFRSILSNSKV